MDAKHYSEVQKATEVYCTSKQSGIDKLVFINTLEGLEKTYNSKLSFRLAGKFIRAHNNKQ